MATPFTLDSATTPTLHTDDSPLPVGQPEIEKLLDKTNLSELSDTNSDDNDESLTAASFYKVIHLL